MALWNVISRMWKKLDDNTPDIFGDLKKRLLADIDTLNVQSTDELIKTIIKRNDEVFLTLVGDVDKNYRDAITKLDRLEQKYTIKKNLIYASVWIVVIVAVVYLISAGKLLICDVGLPNVTGRIESPNCHQLVSRG